MQRIRTSHFIRDNADFAWLHPDVFGGCFYFHRGFPKLLLSRLFYPDKKVHDPEIDASNYWSGVYFRPLSLSSAQFGPPIRKSTTVTFIGSGWCELSEFVTDHVLSYKNRNVLTPVVNREGVPDEVGDDRRSAAPSFDQPLFVLCVQIIDLLDEVIVNEVTLL